MLDVALGVALGLGIARVVRIILASLWYRYAYTPPPMTSLDRPRLFGRWEESVRLPLPVAILRRIMEEPRR